MKCRKCGYVSFDYLSECKKCGIDLTAVRDGLGMLAIKPQPPSCIESIVEGHHGSAAGEPNQEPALFEPTMPTLDLDEKPADLLASQEEESLREIVLEEADTELRDSEVFLDEANPSLNPPDAVPMQPRTEPPAADDLLELDIDFLFDEEEPPQFAKEPAGPPSSASGPAEAATAQQDAEDDLVIEISEDDLHSLLSDLEDAPSEKR